MTVEDTSVNILDPLLTSDHCELRQLPKAVAKTFISLQQKTENNLSKNPLPSEFLTNFGSRVSQLPTGLVLELWKTFLYHLSKDVLPDTSTRKAQNMLALTDQLMSTFLNHSCVVEQALPERLMDKIVELIYKTHTDISTLVTQLPRVQLSLCELSILLKNCRQLELVDVNKWLKDSSEQNLLKRKLESVENNPEDQKPKTKLVCKDVLQDDNVKFLPVIVDELTDKEVLKVAKFVLDKDFPIQSTTLVAEDHRLQVALVITALENLQKTLVKENASKEFLRSVLVDTGSWFKPSGNESKLKDAADMLKELVVIKKDKRVSLQCQEMIQILRVLPLECLRGEFETLISLVVVWMIISQKLVDENTGHLIQAFARCLDGTFRTPSILKYVDFSLLAPKLSTIEIQLEDGPLLDKILQSLSRITSTYQKTLETVSKSMELFIKPLETLNDVNEVRMSVVLLESVGRNLSNKDASQEKKSLSQNIFKSLCESFEKGLKNFDANCLEMKCLVLRAFNSVLDSSDAGGSDSIKKWLKHAPKFTSVCLQAIDGTDAKLSGLAYSSSCKYLSHVWIHQKDIKKLDENFSNDLWSQIVTGNEDFVSGSEDWINLVTKIFQTSDEAVLNGLAKTLLTNTSVAVDMGTDLTHLMHLWTMFVSLNLDESSSQLRKNIVMQLMQILHLKIPVYEPSFYKNFLIPCLNLEAAILETDKPLLHRESESMCLINSSSLNLERVLDTLDSVEDFSSVWKAIYRIASSAFHKRSSSIVLPRIPIMLAILRNLLQSLVRASEQSRKVSASELKELVLLAHYIDRLCEHIRKLKEDFARVAPYLVADVVDCFQRITLYTPVKANLLLAVHKLLDICDKHSIEMLAGILPVGRKDIFKHVTNEYRKYFKYTGKV